jgi:hypothetical protein
LIFLIAFLFPLTVYCLILALINGRERPLMVSGPWDFAGVLFALSGFILAGGPAAITVLDHRWRMFWLTGMPNELRDLGNPSWIAVLAVLSCYFLLIVGGSVLMLTLRRKSASIYNIEHKTFQTTLSEVLVARGLEWTREGRMVWISGRGEQLLLEVDAFPSMRHITLRWRQGAHDMVRHEIDDALRDALDKVQTPDNPAASWFLWTGALLFVFMTGIILLLLTLLWFPRPH